MKKRLISGMFSSVSDAELLTETLDANFTENKDKPNEDLKSEIEKDDNWLSS